MTDAQHLCYLEAGKVTSPVGDLEGMTLASEADEALGTLDGVVIDASERRVRYFVVERRGWLKTRRYLVPADQPVQISDGKSLRLSVEPDELALCEEFDENAIPDFSDEHVITAMFADADHHHAA